MAEPETKKCRTCEIEKPLEEFTPARTCKQGWTPDCKKCAADKARERYARGYRPTRRALPGKREFTENEKNIFRLGVMVGEDRNKDLQKACNIQMRANMRLFEVIREADKRDAKLPIIPD